MQLLNKAIVGRTAWWPAMAFSVCGSAAAQCLPDWQATDGFPGVQSFTFVNALTTWDPDGGGPQAPRLVAGGDFQYIADRVTDNVAAFNPEAGRWEDLGGGVEMVKEGEGGGPVFDLAYVHVLAAYGNDLVAAGIFDEAGGVPVSNIARWDGESWSSLGSGLAGFAEAMTVYNGELIVAGTFGAAGGVGVNNIARWNGAHWQPLGSPAGLNGPVFGVGVYNGELIAVGDFSTAGGAPANRIARWNGLQWQPLGTGLNDGAYGLAVLGGDLYVGGDFTLAGGVPQTKGVARWDGAHWHPVAGGTFFGISDLIVYQGDLIAGGAFTIAAAGGQARQIARLDTPTQTWHTMQGGFNTGAGTAAMAVYEDELIAAGGFSKAGTRTVRGIARWSGDTQSWSSIAPGFNITPTHFITYQDELVAGGSFQSAGDVDANGVARWDGAAWHPLGTGIHNGNPDAFAIPSVFSLGVYSDDLIVGGNFAFAGDVSVQHIAAWSGETQTWSDVGGGVSGAELPRVNALAVYNGELIAAGIFTLAGGVPVLNIARWNGLQWQPLAGGYAGIVNAMIVYNGDLIVTGSGPAGLQRWDGSAWHAIPGGPNGSSLAIFNGQLISGFLDPFVWDGTTWTKLPGWSWDPFGAAAGIFEYVVFQDELIVAGQFENAAGIPEADGLVRFDGTAWSSMATDKGTTASITSGMGVHNGELFTNGRVAHPDGSLSNWRRWGCYTVATLPGCFGNPAALEALSSAATIGGTFSVSLSSSQVATGLGLLFFGMDGTDGAGCGFLAPSLGELLLAFAPPPHQVGSGSLSAGAVEFALPVPGQPALAGLEIAFQGAAVGVFDPGLPIELSNALLVTITQ